jgi:hypothetical protein
MRPRPWRRLSATLAAALALQGAMTAASAPAPKRELAPLSSSKIALVPFENSPFPYRGQIPEKNKPFIDVIEDGRLGHTSPRGGIYWEDQTYSDRRALLYIPRGFDPRRPALIVVFFHGNEATLTRDVRKRQEVPRQVAESGLNAVLVAPQFAVNALDSGAGRFWEPAVFPQFLAEATDRLTELYGDERARGAFFGAPVVLVAYSGGYNPVAFILHAGRVDDRVRGVILLDGLYGEVDKFADCLAAAGVLRQRLRQGGARRQRRAAAHVDRARRALPDHVAGNARARQRVVPRRQQRRDQARGLHDQGLGGRSAQGDAAQGRRILARCRRFDRLHAEEEIGALRHQPRKCFPPAPSR